MTAYKKIKDERVDYKSVGWPGDFYKIPKRAYEGGLITIS